MLLQANKFQSLHPLLLIAHEILNEALPVQHKPDYYITPVLKEMTREWRRTKRRMADAIVRAATIVPTGIQVEEVYDAEDSLVAGFIIDTSTVVPRNPQVNEVLLDEAKKSGLGRLGIGRVRDTRGKLVDVFFDELDGKAILDIKENWGIPSYSIQKYTDTVSGKFAQSRGIVLKNSAGSVQGAVLYRTDKVGGITVDFLETASFNRGKQGYSGVGSNLLGRAGLDVPMGKQLRLESTEAAEGFYKKIGMNKGSRTGDFYFDSNEIQVFAQKMGVSKTARRVIIKETTAVEFTTYGKNQMFKEVNSIMRDYKLTTTNLIADALKKAKGDTIPMLTTVGTGRGGFTTVALSKEGMKEVVDSLQWQQGFVDNLSKSVIDRVQGVTKGRYASSYDARQQINRTFRIDRDKGLASFHRAVDKHAQSMIKGNITGAQFETNMRKSIETHYRKLYKEGKGTTSLKKWEQEFIRKQAQGQEQYLSNFRSYIDTQKVLGKDLTGRVSQRAHLYAERGTAMFEAGHVTSLPDDVLLNWELQPAEHCTTCPDYETGSPYTKQTLPGYPGEGFHLSQCGTNCVCSVQVSKLYVTKTPEPERDLAIEITRPTPPPPPNTAKRDGKDVVTFKGRTYTRQYYQRPGGKRRSTKYVMKDPVTGEVKNISKVFLPREVRDTFRPLWKPPIPKKVTIKGPKPKPKPKPKPIVKHKPTPTIIQPEKITRPKSAGIGRWEYEDNIYYTSYDSQAKKIIHHKYNPTTLVDTVVDFDNLPEVLRRTFNAGSADTAIATMERIAAAKAKYATPKEIRRQINQLISEKDKLRGGLKKQVSTLRRDVKSFKDPSSPLSYSQMTSDPRYKRLNRQLIELQREERLLGKEIRDEVRTLVQANPEGKSIGLSVNFAGAPTDRFKRNVKQGVDEFGKLLDPDFMKSRNRYKTVKAFDGGSSLRAYASTQDIHLATNEATKTVVHEMGHFFENASNDAKDGAFTFLRDRTKNETAITLNKVKNTTIYDATEKTKKDKFIHAYMGKQYTNNTEILSMGLEMMYDDPVKLVTKDPGMFDFIYNACRGIF